MREWASNVDVTAKRVFVSVAVGWLLVFHSIGVVWWYILEDWDEVCGTKCVLTDLLYRMMMAIAWPSHVAMEAHEGVSDTRSGDGVVLAFYLISAVTWATLITVAYDLARRSRERRGASKEV